jgi:hypothetical protein
LDKFQLADISIDRTECQKLWTKFDLDNSGSVRTHVFLRLLDYRITVAEEIDVNVQPIAHQTGVSHLLDRRSMSLLCFPTKRDQANEHDHQQATTEVQPSTIDVDKRQWRQSIEQHRRLTRSLDQDDLLLPFIDRKVVTAARTTDSIDDYCFR